MAVPVHRRRYHWPELQLNIWIMIVFSASAICLGIFAWFMSVQTELKLGIPWYVSLPVSIYLPTSHEPHPHPQTAL